MKKFSELMRGSELIVAPVALNPIMARLAEEAGFKALYLSGGSLGWLKCVTEANLTLPELAAVALDMRAVCQLPIVLDAGGGWGDPVHVHRTIAFAEAAEPEAPVAEGAFDVSVFPESLFFDSGVEKTPLPGIGDEAHEVAVDHEILPKPMPR